MFKKMRGCSLSYKRQVLIRAVCINYDLMPEDIKCRINSLCLIAAGNDFHALFRVLTTTESIRKIAIDMNLSETQLYRYRHEFYERFFGKEEKHSE